MKKLLLSILAFFPIIASAVALMMMGFGVQTASAQVKRGTAAKKPATVAKKPAAKVNNNFAVLEFDEWINHNHPFEDEENIYFLGNGNSPNVLRAVNKQTGEVKIVVPPKKRARTMICCAGSDGKNVYMRLENKGIALFNGIDVNTSEIVVPQSEQYKGFLIYGNRGYNIIGSPNGRYIMLYGDNPIVYDKEEGRVVRYGSSGSTFPVLTDDGMVIDYDYKGLFSQVKGNPVLDYTSPKNNVDRKYFDFKGVDNGANGDVCSIWYDIPDNMVYIAKGEQILKSPVQPDLDFKEVYCLPGENKEFRLVAFNGSRVFAVTDNYQKKFYEWDNKDMTGEPKISQSIDTGVTFTSTSGLTRKYVISDAKRLYYDKAGNLWVQVADGRFIIYNPDGIKGLTALKGKYTENKLPKEED
jgi:hypothetical protein